MYLPPLFEESRLEVLHRLIRSHALGTFVLSHGGELVANHMPFLVDTRGGPYGTLRSHVARCNPLWQCLSDSVEALAIFHGPDAYVTPSWYPSRQADGKVVPTWNYAVVHAYGRVRAIDDPDWLLDHVTQLAGDQEAGRPQSWRPSQAPQDFIEQMLARIVGLEMPISRIQGKWKVSQNRKGEDRLGVVAGLESSGTDACRAMAALVKERLNPTS
jgi:transcriptional regulator